MDAEQHHIPAPPHGAFPAPLFGLEVSVDHALIGSKLAYQLGRRLHVSPAMWALMKDAGPDELRQLLESIRVVNLGQPITFLSLTNPVALSDLFVSPPGP